VSSKEKKQQQEEKEAREQEVEQQISVPPALIGVQPEPTTAPPEVVAAVKEGSAPAYVEDYWAGVKIYRCSTCEFSSEVEFVTADHVVKAHAPNRMAAAQQSGLVDPSGRPI
jgi:hypothetical protein